MNDFYYLKCTVVNKNLVLQHSGLSLDECYNLAVSINKGVLDKTV